MLLARELTERVIGLAIEVHRLTGPGMLESVYEGCLCYELGQAGITFERQAGIPVAYKGDQFDEGFRADVLAYIAFALAPITRQERADASMPFIYAQYDPKLRAFLDFVLAQYVSEGVGELDQAKFVISAPTPFVRAEAVALKRDAVGVIVRHLPDAPAIYAARGWQLPASIARVYDASRAERVLGFRCTTDFQCVLHSFRAGGALPFAHDPGYVSPRSSD
jgi:hypothetical protein